MSRSAAMSSSSKSASLIELVVFKLDAANSVWIAL
jgi:hypothetical protein